MAEKYFIHIPKSTAKQIKRIPAPWRDRIVNAIEILQYDPLLGEKMMGKLKNQRKLRVWPYRILYIIEKKKRIITIVDAGHRQGIYK